jgi:serine/threonine protein kinase
VRQTSWSFDNEEKLIMNHDSFKHIESLFHELSELDVDARNDRLKALAHTDLPKARSLQQMFNSITEHPYFLQPSSIDAIIPSSVEIPLDGTVILGNRYKLVERIGVGGSSTIFRAHASDPSRDVAIKMLRIGVDSQKIRERFALESHALASLTHPHIAHVYQTGLHVCNGIEVPWIAMELITGSQTISDYASTNKLDKASRIELFVKVCEAVRAAHQAGVLHLDLNAANILIDAHGYPKIIDFGLFGILSSLTRTTPIHVGTLISMAPEQTVFHSGSFDQRTDIYALGLLFTELLAGVQLQNFQNSSTEHALKLIAIGKSSELLRELTQIPEELACIIDTCIRVNPDDRYQSIDTLLHAIYETHQTAKQAQTTYFTLPLSILGSLAALVIVVVIAAQLQNGGDKQANHAQPESELISIPRQLAIDLTSQNPRKTQYSTVQSNLVEGLGSVLEADPNQSSEEQATLYSELADQNRVAGHYDNAIEYYLKSAQLLKESGLPIDYNWVMLSLIQTYIFLERIDHAQHALDLLDRTVDLSILFRVDLSLAESAVHIAMNHPEDALRQANYTGTLINELRMNDERMRIERLLDLATIYEATASYQSASTTLLAAKSVGQQSENYSPAEIALIDLKIGIYDAPNASDESLVQVVEDMERAVIKLLESGDNFHAAWGQRQIGNVHLRSSQFEKAGVSYAKAYAQMVQILGHEHHESIICRAFELIARHANGDNRLILNEDFNNSIEQLTNKLGANHSMISSLQNDWEQVFIWNSITP